ncbi:MAG: hypothetical protein ACJ735_02345 [Actinomycetes bacterium]
MSVAIGIWLLVLAMGLAAGCYRLWRNQQRIALLRQFSVGKGWRFWSEDDEYALRWHCPPFGQGRHRRARNVILGTYHGAAAPWQFAAFDYSYVTDSSDSKSSSSQTHRFAVCAVSLPTYLPPLCVTPSNLLTRMSNAVLGEQIELESEDFNRRFHVESPVPKFASDVLPPRTMESLLRATPLHLRVQGDVVLCWEPGVLTPLPLLARLATVCAFADGIPGFVWHDYGPETGANAGTESR